MQSNEEARSQIHKWEGPYYQSMVSSNQQQLQTYE